MTIENMSNPKLPTAWGLYLIATNKYYSFFALIPNEDESIWNRLGGTEFASPKHFEKTFGKVETISPLDWQDSSITGVFK